MPISVPTSVAAAARRLCLPRIAPLVPRESTNVVARADSTDASDAAEPTENADANEPTEPTDRAEPTEHRDNTDPREPTDRNESSDHNESPATKQRLANTGLADSRVPGPIGPKRAGRAAG